MFTVKISYPNKLESYEAEMILVNTIVGIIGIKSNHVNLVTQLSDGFIKIFDIANNEIKSIIINSGLLKFINAENCCLITVLN